MTEPKRMIPPAAKQAWEELQDQVASHNAQENSVLRDDHREVERRVTRLEARLTAVGVGMVSKLEGLAASYGVMAKAMDKLVTKDEFEPTRGLVQVIVAAIVIVAIAIIARGLFMS